MEKISPEIAREIIRHIESKKDLANVRLVQRSFSDLATEFLFRVIPVTPTRLGLFHLLALSRKPGFAFHIKEVALLFDRIDYAIWPNFYKNLKLANIDPNEDCGVWRVKIMQLAKSAFKDYKEFKTSPDYTAMLSTAFVRLPRLEAITIGKRDPRDRPNYPVSQYITSSEGEGGRFYSEGKGTADFTRAFGAMVDAAYLADAKILYFRADAFRPFVGALSIDKSAWDNPHLLPRAAAVFRNCRVIELGLYHHKDDGTGPLTQRIREKSLYFLFVAARNLEELVITFNLRGGGNDLFRNVFGTQNSWPHLTKMEYSAIDVPMMDLITFLARYVKTLRRISIHNSRLLTGVWLQVARFMQRFLQLVSLKFDTIEDQRLGKYTDEVCTKMSKYVLSGGDPPLRADSVARH